MVVNLEKFYYIDSMCMEANGMWRRVVFHGNLSVATAHAWSSLMACLLLSRFTLHVVVIIDGKACGGGG